MATLLAHPTEHSTILGDERGRRIILDHLAVVQNQNPVVVDDSMQSMSNREQNASAEPLADSCLDPVSSVFRERILVQ